MPDVTPRSTPPIALTIAGSDPSGGAGIQADLKTFTALGVYGASVITALTAQNTVGVSGVFRVPPGFIKAQFDAVASDLAIRAIKTGMLADTATVEVVAACLGRLAPQHLVVDPVMVATSGDRLIGNEAIAALRTQLIPRATVITPNLTEAAILLDTEPAETAEEMQAQAQALLQFGCAAVLLKGGHGEGGEAVDLLVTSGRTQKFAKPRISTTNTHGTGCTLAAAIAAGLSKGEPLGAAIETAKDFVWRALRSAASQQIGAGHGPIDHIILSRT